MYSYWELGLIAFILLGIGCVLWKGGAANPVGTASLQHDMRNIRQESLGFGRRLKALEETTASSAEVEKLGRAISDQQGRMESHFLRLDAMERQVAGIQAVVEATSQSVRAIDARQDTMAETIAAIGVQSAATGRQVDRLYDHIVNKGMNS